MDPVETHKKYKYIDILEMLGGNQYYSEATTKYIFYKMNGDLELADQYLKITLEEANRYKTSDIQLKSQDEIDLINKLKDDENK